MRIIMYNSLPVCCCKEENSKNGIHIFRQGVAMFSTLLQYELVMQCKKVKQSHYWPGQDLRV